MRKLAAADPGNAEWQRGMSVSLDSVGNARLVRHALTGGQARAGSWLYPPVSGWRSWRSSNEGTARAKEVRMTAK